MNVSIEKIDNVNGKITVSIEENDYKDKVTSELKRIGKTHTLPGFRKGHVTIDQLRRRFGKQVKSDVINQEVYEAVINYIRDNKLAILGEPLPVEVKEIDMNSVDYTFEYEIGLTPEINVDLKKVIRNMVNSFFPSLMKSWLSCPRSTSGRFLRYHLTANGWKDSIQ